MEITIDDFEEEYIEQFSEEQMRYIIDFANTFQKTFPDIMDKDTLIKRLSWLKHIECKPYVRGSNGLTSYPDNEIQYIDGLSEQDERNVIYHELFHVISYHVEPEHGKQRIIGLYEEGAILIGDDPHTESNIFDEMMNEFYSTKMLKTEGIVNQYEFVLKRETQVDRSKETVRYHGTGYGKYTQLAGLYDRLFGSDLLNAKLFNKVEFEKKFNERYKDVSVELPDEEETPLFAKVGKQIHDTYYGSDLYGAFGTAIEIWKVNEQERIDNNGFNLFDYIKASNELISYLPKRDDQNAYRTDKSNEGVPDEIFTKITQMDKEFICRYLRPDILDIQDEEKRNREINSILTIINILRENINELSEQDLENITYGYIEENKQDGRNCLIVRAGSMEFMTFVSDSEEAYYQFSAYSKFKRVQDYSDFNWQDEAKQSLTDELRKEGLNVNNYGYAIILDNRFYNGRCSVIESDGKYYKTESGIEEISLSDCGNIDSIQRVFNPEQLESDLIELASSRTISEFSEMSENIRGRVNENNRAMSDIKSDREI